MSGINGTRIEDVCSVVSVRDRLVFVDKLVSKSELGRIADCVCNVSFPDSIFLDFQNCIIDGSNLELPVFVFRK